MPALQDLMQRLRAGLLQSLRTCTIALGIIAAPTATAATLPAGFTQTQVATGLQRPTAMAFAPDGRLFVAEQGGALRVIKNSALLSTPFLSVTVSSVGERGLLGVAFDPNFATNRHVYVYYTATTPAVHNRVSRFTANGDTALAGSETVILELNNLSTETNHNGGAMHFGPDGKLYIAVGENANGANAQSLSNLLGKMLRINSDGTIPADNPFPAATGNNRAIWALGLRNPFTFAFQPGTGRMFINDVGEITWEEIDDGIAGSNYGWPSSEGPTSNPSFRSPIYWYGHGTGNFLGCAITGGTFYNPAVLQFPGNYAGVYFFADFCGDWINVFDHVNGTVSSFATGIGAPVDLQVGPDGSLYYLARDPGVVGRIDYVANLGGPLANASFEIPALGSGYQYRPSGTGIGWIFSGQSGIQGNGSAWGAATAPHGTQTAFIQNLGSVAQTIDLSAGNYTLSFRAARRAFSIPAGSVQPIWVSIDGQQIGSLVAPPSTSFTTVTIPFTVGSTGSHTLQFAGTDGSGDKSTFVDTVVITPSVTQGEITNPGFEIPALGSGYQYSPSGTGIGWIFTNGSGIQGNGSAWGAATAPDGTQTAFIQNLGSVAQTIGLSAGNYTLSFRAARRAHSIPAGSVQPIRVSVDGQQIGSLVAPPSTSFTTVTIPFTVGSTGSHTLQFAGTDGSGDKSTFVDTVVITPSVTQGEITNPGFEIPALGSGYQYSPSGTGIGWIFTNGSGIQGNGSAWGAATAPDGTQTAFIQNLGSVAQTIGLSAGNYTLSFRAARRAHSIPAGSVQPIRVSVDGQQIGSLVAPPSTSFTTVAIPFTVGSTGSHTLQFAGTDGSGDKSTFVDTVAITQ